MINKTLITGAGTLTKAILTEAHDAAQFTVFSRSELNQAQLRRRFPKARYILGDVRDYATLSAAIAGHDTVIHGAAMKRIPECEAHPIECYSVNVLGSVNVARACIAQGVTNCVGISTDKACMATTAYGASKLAMEKIFRAQDGSVCKFTLVRYGNVIASRGSVIQIWQEQEKAGKPLTITDGEMTRFWMSPFAAVALIVKALGLTHGVCVVPKMGALSIGELARIVAPSAPLVTTGLRSEEKRHEDLIHPNEVARESSGYFLVGAQDGELGHTYTSATAHKLTAQDIKQLLADAKELE